MKSRKERVCDDITSKGRGMAIYRLIKPREIYINIGDDKNFLGARDHRENI